MPYLQCFSPCILTQGIALCTVTCPLLSACCHSPPCPTGDVGRVSVAELSWGDADQITAVDPPFDYIVGTDVVSVAR